MRSSILCLGVRDYIMLNYPTHPGDEGRRSCDGTQPADCECLEENLIAVGDGIAAEPIVLNPTGVLSVKGRDFDPIALHIHGMKD